MLCKRPETVDHVSIVCWDAVFFWDILKITLKKELYINAHTITFISLRGERIKYDVIIILGLYSIWMPRMGVPHADIPPKPVHVFLYPMYS